MREIYVRTVQRPCVIVLHAVCELGGGGGRPSVCVVQGRRAAYFGRLT